MIHAIAASSVAGYDVARRGGENFSYAMAAAATRESAARALEAHGGAPASTQQQATSPAKTPAPGAAAPAPATSADQQSAAPSTQNAPAPEQRNAAAAAARTTPLPAPAQSSGANPSIIATTTAARASATGHSASALRETPASRASRASSTPAPTPPQQQFATEEFARILAERLADQTRFEIDLSVEGLGRVEGRLILGDDGAASLALAFDRAETLDQFLRDGAALRAHLESSGFAFGERDLRLAHRQNAPEAATLRADHAEAPHRLIAGRTIDILI
jgi:hypothetical protein